MTDIDQPQLKQSPQALISALTLLPLARYVRLKVLALEEPTNDTKTEPKRGDPGDLILGATTTESLRAQLTKHLAALIQRARKPQALMKGRPDELP